MLGRRRRRRAHHVGLAAGRAQRILFRRIVYQGGRVVAGQAHRPFNQVRSLPSGIRPALAERRHRRDDQPRIERMQDFIAEPEGLQMAGRIVFDQDVGIAHQTLEDFRAARRRGIERHAFLAGVEVEKESALLRMRPVAGKRRMASRLVALAWRLELDHLRAHVGEQFAAHRPRDHRGVFNDLDVIQRCGGQFRCLPDSSLRKFGALGGAGRANCSTLQLLHSAIRETTPILSI